MQNTIRIGIPYYKNILPWTHTSNWNTLSVLNLFAEPLTRSFDGKIWPALAKSWQVYDHGKRWVFSLRPKATFHDNSPCTSMDVLASIETAKTQVDEMGMPSPLPSYLRKVEFNLIDRQTIEAVSEEPNGDISDYLSEILISKANRSGEFVIGTGDYEFVDYVPRRSLRLKKIGDTKRFSAYKEISYKVIADAEERLDALKNGIIDYATDIQNLNHIPAIEGYNWFRTISALSIIGLLNGKKEPFCYPDARRAINMAINTSEMIDEIFQGNGIRAATVVSPFHCGFESSIKPIAYDPDEAKRLFSKVNMPDELVIRAPTNTPINGDKIAYFIKDQLASIGIQAHVDVQPNRLQYALDIARKDIGDIAIANALPHSTFRTLSDCISSEERGACWQSIEDTTCDKLIKIANTEPDITTRERKYATVLEYLGKNPPWLYLLHPVLINVSIPSINDIQLLHSGIMRFPGSW